MNSVRTSGSRFNLSHLGSRFAGMALLVGGALVAGDAEAAVIASYQASGAIPQNPTNQGWSESGTLTTVYPGTETIGGKTYSYWDITNPSSQSGSSRFYRSNFTNTSISGADGWTATAVVRVTEAPSEWTNAFLEVADGKSIWTLNLINTPTYGSKLSYVDSAGGLKNISTVNMSSDYITLQMYYNFAEKELDVYVDGVKLASLGSSLFRTTSGFYVRWGDNDASPRATNTQSHWNFVSLETGNHVIPEGSTVGLLSLGAGLLLLWREKRSPKMAR